MPSILSIFDASLDVSPPLGDEALAAIPAKRGVLALLAEGDQVIVVLTVADIRARLRSRLAEKAPDQKTKAADLRAITKRIVWKLAQTNLEADLNYFEIVRMVWPRTYRELLSWKAPWFVHVDPAETYPHFQATRDVLAGPGEYLGPFESGRSAGRFIETIEDGFDLCRRYTCLRQAPHGQPCTYLQIGKCLGPCNGTISLEDYRRVVARAAAFAAGERAALRETLTAEMKSAAADLEFERAAKLKGRLERLAELEAEEFRFVRPAGQFEYIFVHGLSKTKATVFLAHLGSLAKGPPLDYPPKCEQVEAALAMLTSLRQSAASVDETDRLRMGLVAHYLFSSVERRGLVIESGAGLTADGVVAAVENAREALGLCAPASRKPPGEATA